MKIPDFHLPTNPSEAVELQKNLSRQLILKGEIEDPELIAGVDCSSYGNTGLMVGAVVIWSVSKGMVVDASTASWEAEFPYIPGLLAFREIPVLMEAFRKLETVPDVVICDGQGTAHMRGFGIACHLGLMLKIPTLGCGKSRLVGSYQVPAESKTASTRLVYKGETVGRVVRTRDGIKPLFVSPGHLISIQGSVRVIMKSCTKYRLPEPIRAAHKLAGETMASL